ncbi:hypothetical protein [Bacillus mycoides]|uniref:hypothetical protein n=1 Tax=Bacillus mycoides TaxID=1405 RepID=UPI001F396622|nr:hypothetical protein [Bacillus mycoides]
MGVVKRVNIILLKLVKGLSMYYKERSLRPPKDSYQLMKETEREYFIFASLDTKKTDSN